MNISKGGHKLTRPLPKKLPLSDLINDVFDGPRRIHFIQDGVPYIRLGDLDAGEIYFDPNQKIAPADLDQHFYLRPEDVLVTKTGDEPRAMITSSETENALTAPDIYCLRVNKDLISPTWLAYYLNTSFGQRLLSDKSSGSVLRRLNLTELRSLPIVFPPLSLVTEIETLERQAQEHTLAAHDIWTATQKGMYSEIDERSLLKQNTVNLPLNKFLDTLSARKVYRSLGEVAQIAISSRKLLKPDQIVKYVQVSDIDPRSFLFRRQRKALAKDLPSRIRLPLQSFQVLLLALGSNLGTPTHPVAVVDAQLEGGFASNAFLALEFAETQIYFAISLKHPIVLEQLHQMAVGATVSTIRRKDIVNLKIPVLSNVWRQDFNGRALVAWERRSLALALRRQAIEKAESFLQQMMDEG